MARDVQAYRVVIASPGDVRVERDIVHRVIEQLNGQLQDAGESRRLEVYRWENVSPDVGFPQTVILKQIPIEKCDILIAILWKRFGSPPYASRPADEESYRSGTQVEIDEALKARRASKSGRPRIMIYRKMDPIPPDMSDDDFAQLEQVRTYLKQFDTEGATPALVSKFYSPEFADNLMRHLRQAIAQFRAAEDDQTTTAFGGGSASATLSGDKKQGASVDNADLRLQLSSLEEGPIDALTADARRIWLGKAGLRDDPFTLSRADEESALTHYFITPQGISVPDLIDIRRPDVVFGRPGSGKTTLRKIVAAACFPHKIDSGLLALECGRTEIEKMLELVDGVIDRLQPVHAARVLAQLLLGQIEALAEERKVSFPAGQRQQFDWLNTADSRAQLSEWLKAVTRLLAAVDLKHVLFLVDQVDELAILQRRPEAVAALLEPLFALELREARGLAFNYFLPESIALLLTGNARRFRLDRCEVSYLRWNGNMLKRLVQQRLKTYSTPLSGLSSLGQLCESGTDFARTIDDELVTLAAENPRAALWLAGQLLHVHCENGEPPRQIQAASWAQVQTRWFLTGRRLLFPAAAFWANADKIFYQEREIKLKPRSQRLLACLIRGEGQVCEFAEVARAGWPDDEAAGVSKHAVEEAMRRMKLELAENGIDSSLIQTVRGQGYRLGSASGDATYNLEQE